MLQYFRSIGLALLLSVGVGSVGQAASFDCTKAATETEIAICSDFELSALDELMGVSLKQLLETFPKKFESILIDQKQWIISQSKCADSLDCLHWMFSNWFSEFTSNMSLNIASITAPELDSKLNTIKFDRRTCEFFKFGIDEEYNCSSSLLHWDRIYRSCSFAGFVLQTKKTNDGVNLIIWENDFSYFAEKDPLKIINVQYGSGGNPFRFWIEGDISNTVLGVLGDQIYIAPPDNFSGPYPLYKMGDGSSDWQYYDSNFSDLVPKMTMMLVMVDGQIPHNCVALSKLN